MNNGQVPAWLAREGNGTNVVFTSHREGTHGHGRFEERECWALADPELNAFLGSAGTVGDAWPHLRQIVRIERKRTVKGRTSGEVTDGVTSVSETRAHARQLLEGNRSYWGIENRLQWVRDETLGEDRSQVRSGKAPPVMAALRNVTLALLRRAKVINVAAALRTYAARPSSAVALVLAPLLE